jgi:myo-inositol-1(or 4)-monophosphatase
MILTELRRAKEVAVEAAKVAGDILLKEYQQRRYRTRTKADTSLQTGADLAAEQAILACIHTAFGDHTIESEEQGVWKVGASPYRWKIDPLDGTENFVLGLPYFSSTLLLSYDDQPVFAVVYEPVTHNLYTAERDAGAWLNGERIQVSHTHDFRQCRTFLIPDFVTKRETLTALVRQELYQRCRRVLDTWSPALDWCLVESLRADLVVALAGSPLTPDAGTLILEEAGGRITDFSGQRFNGRKQRCLIGSNGTELHDRLLHVLDRLQEKEPCQEIPL